VLYADFLSILTRRDLSLLQLLYASFCMKGLAPKKQRFVSGLKKSVLPGLELPGIALRINDP
jgi:hypothetical protein